MDWILMMDINSEDCNLQILQLLYLNESGSFSESIFML